MCLCVCVCVQYLMDPEKVANLLQIPQFFDLDIYTSCRQEKVSDVILQMGLEILFQFTNLRGKKKPT